MKIYHLRWEGRHWQCLQVKMTSFHIDFCSKWRHCHIAKNQAENKSQTTVHVLGYVLWTTGGYAIISVFICKVLTRPKLWKAHSCRKHCAKKGNSVLNSILIGFKHKKLKNHFVSILYHVGLRLILNIHLFLCLFSYCKFLSLLIANKLIFAI